LNFAKELIVGNRRKNPAEDTMENRKEDYWEYEDGEGHVDTRKNNFECDNKDEHLGCNLGIDVAG
jgi:hypothetical protein